MEAAEKNSSKSLREHAEKNPTFQEVLLNKAEFQDKKHATLSNKEEYKKVLDQVELVLSKVEAELASHSDGKEAWWLCSDRFTLADIGLTILLDRLNRLGLENHFWETKNKPCITRYYKRVQERDSYKKTVPSSLVHVQMLLRLQSPIVMGIGMAAAIAVIGGIMFYRKQKGY